MIGPDRWIELARTLDTETRAALFDSLLVHGVAILSEDGAVRDPTACTVRHRIAGGGDHLVVGANFGEALCTPSP